MSLLIKPIDLVGLKFNMLRRARTNAGGKRGKIGTEGALDDRVCRRAVLGRRTVGVHGSLPMSSCSD